jgi:hypothetical protein
MPRHVAVHAEGIGRAIDEAALLDEDPLVENEPPEIRRGLSRLGISERDAGERDGGTPPVVVDDERVPIRHLDDLHGRGGEERGRTENYQEKNEPRHELVRGYCVICGKPRAGGAGARCEWG